MAAGRPKLQGVGKRPVAERLRGLIQGGGPRRGWGRNKRFGRCGGRVAVRVHQTQEMKGKEGIGDPGGQDAKSGRYSSGGGLCPSGEKRLFC